MAQSRVNNNNLKPSEVRTTPQVKIYSQPYNLNNNINRFTARQLALVSLSKFRHQARPRQPSAFTAEAVACPCVERAQSEVYSPLCPSVMEEA